jgi:cytochrome P450
MAKSVPRPAERNPLSLITHPERAKILADARGGAPFYDSRLKLWIVLDHEQSTNLLTNECLAVPEIGDALAAIEKRYALSLPHLRWVAGKLPLLLNGNEHRRTRQGLARLLSAEKKEGGAWREPVERIVAAALSAPGPVELVGRLLRPAVDAVFSAMTHIDVSFEPLTLTKVFDHYAGYREIVALEQHIGDLRRRLAEAGVPDASLGAHAALIILGRDSLLASLADGLIDALEARIGKRLDDAAAPRPRLFGGVAIAERLVRSPFDFNETSFAAGDRIRLYFQGYNYLENETERLGFFGSGAHSCVGRPLALDVWAVLAKEVFGGGRTVGAVRFEYARSVIFTLPRFIELELA